MKLLNKSSHFVMEATVYYHYKLACFLQENEVLVSLENPLTVKRFIQRKFSKIKTDKSNSKMICKYTEKVELLLGGTKQGSINL